MQAIVLVGGQGTRLQPLTLTTPKPLVPLANRPLIDHIASWIEGHGVTDIVLATHYRAAAFGAWLQERRGIPVHAEQEAHPLGTAGAVANVRHLLHTTTVVINGDNLTNLDLRAMAQAHQATGAVVTIAVDHVADPTGRGVVVIAGDGRITRFQEKPAPGTALGTTVNTGTYIIEMAALDGLVPGQAAMWETDVFPMLIDGGVPIYAFMAPHLWIDVGTPAGYFTALDAVLLGSISAPAGKEATGIWSESEVEVITDISIEAPIAVGLGAMLAKGISLRGPLSIGRRCVIGTGAHIQHSAIWDGSTIAVDASIRNSIVGYNCRIGADARIDGALVGDGATISPGASVGPGSRITPGSVVGAD